MRVGKCLARLLLNTPPHSGKLFANEYICSFCHAALWLNQEISSVKNLVHSPLCCKTTMQTNGRLTNCPGNNP